MGRLETRLWERCMTLLKKYRRRASPRMKVTILRDASPFPNEDLFWKANKDLDIYPLFDALAMWVQDRPEALANYHPKLRNIVAKIVNTAEQGIVIF